MRARSTSKDPRTQCQKSRVLLVLLVSWNGNQTPSLPNSKNQEKRHHRTIHLDQYQIQNQLLHRWYRLRFLVAQTLELEQEQ